MSWVTQENAFSLDEQWKDIEVTTSLNLDRRFMDDLRVVSAFRDEGIWALLYRITYRLLYENKDLLFNPLDADVMVFESKKKLIQRDMHKMKAFVRFKEIEHDEGKMYVAWHRPDHRVTRLIAPFFKDRFNGMKWMIMTEDECVSWDGKELQFLEGVSRDKAPQDDEMEELWKTYYKSIFNPARLKIGAMKKELPVRHWSTLPETELISELIKEAPGRVETFTQAQNLPRHDFQTLPELYQSMEKCRACGICEKSSGAVKGEGPANAKVLFIGEQPGNEEDLQRRPFIGSAGKLLNRALEEAELNRQDIYFTNAVKGFKFIPKDKLRWHRTANPTEVSTCRMWLKKEIEIIKPEVIVCLGRTAALSVLGKLTPIQENRGKFFETPFANRLLITAHPAAVLRSENEDEDFHQLVNDLRLLRN